MNTNRLSFTEMRSRHQMSYESFQSLLDSGNRKDGGSMPPGIYSSFICIFLFVQKFTKAGLTYISATNTSDHTPKQ